MIKKIGVVSRYDKHEALEMVERIIARFRDEVDIFLSPGLLNIWEISMPVCQ
jgi:cell fate (sporulation/competence/biofilm development) regulator YmcA (YheA/YmcA/DUF963 family)